MSIDKFYKGKIAVVCFNEKDAKDLSKLCNFSLDLAPYKKGSSDICYFCNNGVIGTYSFQNIPDMVMCKIYSFARFLKDLKYSI